VSLIQDRNLVSVNNFSAFGIPSDNSERNPFGFTGEYTDSESGLVFLRNRMYCPRIGRFTSADPLWDITNLIFGDDEVSIKHALMPQDTGFFTHGMMQTQNAFVDVISAWENATNGEFFTYDGVNFDQSSWIREEPTDERPMPSIEAIRQSGNLYVYTMNNPIMWVDPSGLAVPSPDKIFIFLVKVGEGAYKMYKAIGSHLTRLNSTFVRIERAVWGAVSNFEAPADGGRWE